MISMGSVHGGGPRGMLDQFGKAENSGKIAGSVLKRLLAFVLPYTPMLVVAGLCMVVTTAGGLLTPWIIRQVIDVHITNRDMAGLVTAVTVLVAATIAAQAAAGGQTWLLSRVGQQVLRDMRDRLFNHLQALSVAYHDRSIIGVTISRVMNDVATINTVLSQGLVTMVGDSVLIVGTLVILVAMDWRLALLTFTIIPVMIVATVLFSRRARVAYRETRERVAAVVGELAENISGMKVIQAFSQEKSTQDKFDKTNSKNRDAAVRAMSLSLLFMPAMDVLSVTATAIVLVGGGIMAVNGTMTIGTVVAFMSYVGRFFIPIRDLSQIYTTLQAASAGGEKVLELLDTKPLINDPPNPAQTADLTGRITLDAVHFHYIPGTEVLKDINLTIHAGETLAVVGHTGAGKSSLVNLILRFYDVSAGAVLVDGTDIREISQETLHRHTGFVSQDPFLFMGTVVDNIAFGRDGVDRDRAIAAARRSGIHEVIERLPEGYDTRIQEGGANFSTGQRQLISIARAIYIDPTILVMDEATSSVDTITESRIQNALSELLKNRTAIVIAHRLSTVRNADRIIVIDDGRIVEEGTHDALTAQNGIYADLYQKQFIGIM